MFCSLNPFFVRSRIIAALFSFPSGFPVVGDSDCLVPVSHDSLYDFLVREYGVDSVGARSTVKGHVQRLQNGVRVGGEVVCPVFFREGCWGLNSHDSLVYLFGSRDVVASDVYSRLFIEVFGYHPAGRFSFQELLRQLGFLRVGGD